MTNRPHDERERLLMLLAETVRALCNQAGWEDRANDIDRLMPPIRLARLPSGT
jgi:hypothetical protein